MVQLLLDLGADINAVDANGETAVHGAAYKNLPKVVKLLVARSAKIDVWNQPNKFGWTQWWSPPVIASGTSSRPPETEAAVREAMIAAGVTPPANDRGNRPIALHNQLPTPNSHLQKTAGIGTLGKSSISAS